MAHQRRRTVGFANTAEYQSGSISRDQLRRTGLTDGSIQRLIARGDIERVHPSAYIVSGSAKTWLGKQHSAILWAGPQAVASHRSAAKLLGLKLPWEGAEITLPFHTKPRSDGLVVHYGNVREAHVTTIHGIPTMRAARMFLTLGAVMPEPKVARLLDEGVRNDFVTIPELEEMLLAEGGRGVRGVGMMRRLVAERGGEVLDSELERLLWGVIKRSGLPLPERQFWITADFRVDFAYPVHKLFIEADSLKHHTEASDFQRDRERQNVLINLCWRVLRFTWYDVKYQPQYVVDMIRKALSL